MSEMKFEASANPLDLLAAMLTKVEDKINSFMLKYLQIFDNATYLMLIDQIPDKIEKLIRAGKTNKAKAEIDRLEKIWFRHIKEIATPKADTDSAKIHILKKELKLSTYDYRNILMQEAGKQSSATMRKYEIELSLRGMRLFAAGKLEVIPWDVDKKP